MSREAPDRALDFRDRGAFVGADKEEGIIRSVVGEERGWRKFGVHEFGSRERARALGLEKKRWNIQRTSVIWNSAQEYQLTADFGAT